MEQVPIGLNMSKRSVPDLPPARRSLRTGLALFALLLAAVTAAVEVALQSPISASGGYQLALLSGIGVDVLTFLMLAAFARWPVENRRASQLLLLGATLFALAVMYRVGIGAFDYLINANNPPFALPSGPDVDLRVETAGQAAGAWLLALGLWRENGDWPSIKPASVLMDFVAALSGITVAILVTRTADLPWFPEAHAAVFIVAFAALGWAVIARFVIAVPNRHGAKTLIVLASVLMLIAAAVNALGLLATHRMSGPLGSYETYVQVSVIRLLGWLALIGGVLLLGRPKSLRARSANPPRLEFDRAARSPARSAKQDPTR